MIKRYFWGSLLFIGFIACNTREGTKQELILFEEKWASKLVEVAEWADNLSLDTTFVIEYGFKSNKIYLYYEDDEGRRAGTFTPKQKIPKNFYQLFESIWFTSVTKVKNTKVYIFRIGELDANIVISLRNDQEIPCNIEELKADFENVYQSDWAFSTGKSKLIFFSESVSLP